MNVIIAGGRNFDNFLLLKLKCDKILKECKNVKIVCGMAQGADLLGKEYAEKRGYSVIEKPAHWDDLTVENCVIKTNKRGKKYNALAGHNRNEEMAKIGDALIAFWDGKSTGTKDMIDRARNHGLKVRVIKFA